MNIYKARRAILGCDEPPIVADIPKSYNIPPVPLITSKLETSRPSNQTTLSVISPALTPVYSFTPNYLYPVKSPFNFNNIHQSMGSSG